MVKYYKAIEWVKGKFWSNLLTPQEKQYLDDLQHLVDICSKPNTIKYDLEHISDILGNCYEFDDNGKLVKSEWNDDVEEANQEIYDIKMSYSWRMLDTKVLNEIKDMVGMHNDVGLKKRINELLDCERQLKQIPPYVDESKRVSNE